MRELERSLVELAHHVAYPPEPNLVPMVRARLQGHSQKRSIPAPSRAPRWRWALVAAMVVLVASTASLAALPSLRSAVADLLGIGGVRIQTGGQRPAPAGASLDLGDPISLEDARARVDFDVVVPEALGDPDEVFLDELVPGGQVALVYLAGEGLPATPGSDAGALITQFRGSIEDPVLKKLITAEPGTVLKPVTVNRSRGYWMSGGPHFISYIGPDGAPREETVRLVGNVLLWEQNGVTLRIESALTKREALAIAESLN